MAAPAYNTSGDLVKDGILFDNYNNAGDFLGYEGAGAQSALYSRSTYGGTAQTDFNVSFNFKDQYFLGIGVGITTHLRPRELLWRDRRGRKVLRLQQLVSHGRRRY
jgi:hypothetical protein